MSALPLASGRLSKLRILCINDILDGDLCKLSFIPYCLFFLFFFKHDFIGCVDFITASNTASDDVTKQVTHRIFNTDLLYSCAHFVVEIDEKSSLNGGF